MKSIKFFQTRPGKIYLAAAAVFAGIGTVVFGKLKHGRYQPKRLKKR